MIPNDQLKTVPVDKRPVRGAAQDISPKLERTWFKFDRNVVLHQIDKIQGTINENAKQLGMVAAEGVFEKAAFRRSFAHLASAWRDCAGAGSTAWLGRADQPLSQDQQKKVVTQAWPAPKPDQFSFRSRNCRGAEYHTLVG